MEQILPLWLYLDVEEEEKAKKMKKNVVIIHQNFYS